MNGFPLKEVASYTYLGVTVENNLKWGKHVDNICGSAKRTLGYLKRNFQSATTSAKLMVYKIAVRPVLGYRNVIWDPHQKKSNIKKLQKVQRLASRHIFSRYKRTGSVSDMLKQLLGHLGYAIKQTMVFIEH